MEVASGDFLETFHNLRHQLLLDFLSDLYYRSTSRSLEQDNKEMEPTCYKGKDHIFIIKSYKQTSPYCSW